jgi:hypothetical protein
VTRGTLAESSLQQSKVLIGQCQSDREADPAAKPYLLADVFPFLSIPSPTEPKSDRHDVRSPYLHGSEHDLRLRVLPCDL